MRIKNYTNNFEECRAKNSDDYRCYCVVESAPGENDKGGWDIIFVELALKEVERCIRMDPRKNILHMVKNIEFFDAYGNPIDCYIENIDDEDKEYYANEISDRAIDLFNWGTRSTVSCIDDLNVNEINDLFLGS